MNGFFIVVGIGMVAVFGFLAYNLRVGFNADLREAKRGELYRFKYLQPTKGKAERYMVKILDSRPMTTNEITRLNNSSRYRRNDPMFIRTGHLVTGQCSDGTIRNFYAERTSNVRRPLLGGVVFNSRFASFLV